MCAVSDSELLAVWRYLKERCHTSDKYAEDELVYWLAWDGASCKAVRQRVCALLLEVK